MPRPPPPPSHHHIADQPWLRVYSAPSAATSAVDDGVWSVFRNQRIEAAVSDRNVSAPKPGREASASDIGRPQAPSLPASTK